MHRRLTRLTLPALLALSLTACGGGDSDDNDPVPSGGALADVQFMDSESYHPLDKVDASGVFIPESSPAYGTLNPLRKPGDQTMSHWAIDTSVEPPQGTTLEYSMAIEPIMADGSAYNSLLVNLRIDKASGMIYQQCRGYPTCYDNSSGSTQEFRITAVARVPGSTRSLERTFIFRVLAN